MNSDFTKNFLGMLEVIQHPLYLLQSRFINDIMLCKIAEVDKGSDHFHHGWGNVASNGRKIYLPYACVSITIDDGTCHIPS